MELKDIRSRNDFIEYLKEWDELGLEGTDADIGRAADWFIAVQEAHALSASFGIKDIASMFLDGVVGIKQNPEEYHQDWWNTIWEDIDNARADGDSEDADAMEREQTEGLTVALRKHFGLDN